MANTFVHTENTNKLILNVTNGTNNNAGFNLANFKPKFIRDYFEDVLADYERSFMARLPLPFATNIYQATNSKSTAPFPSSSAMSVIL